MHWPHFVICGALTLAACGSGSGDNGDSDGGDDPFAGKTCAMDVATQGALTLDIAPSQDPACAVSLTTNDQISFYMFTVEDSERFSLRVFEVTKGQTGTGFMAEASFSGADENEFESMDCVVDIDEQELLGPHELGEEYRVLGRGTCPDAVDGNGQTITVEPFAFVVAVPWET